MHKIVDGKRVDLSKEECEEIEDRRYTQEEEDRLIESLKQKTAAAKEKIYSVCNINEEEKELLDSLWQ